MLLLVCDWLLGSHGTVVYGCLTCIYTRKEFEKQSLGLSFKLQTPDKQVRGVATPRYFCGNKNNQGIISAISGHIVILDSGLFQALFTATLQKKIVKGVFVFSKSLG